MGNDPSYELVMPFVVVASKGGPFDDESFAAGWQCAVIDEALGVVGLFGARITKSVRLACLPQMELIAMKHLYELRRVSEADDDERDDGWAVVGFVPYGAADH